jgi:hypothetical protein
VIAGSFEDQVRIEVVMLVEQVVEDLGAHQLEAVLTGIGAVILVADHLAVGTHLGLGAQLQGAKQTRLHRLAGLDGNPLLQSLGGQEEEAVTTGQGRSQGRVQHGSGLATAGWCTQQQVTAVSQRVADRLADHRL